MTGKSETHYTWRVITDGRLLVPHSNPRVYEYPIDMLFDSKVEAQKFLVDQGLVKEARKEKWALCVKTITVVGWAD
ncbi:MAG TPA: hypothetical protein VMW90_05175 [Acidobacteriota bacterium]|nr:hypothetical protein [Acidobacteriota bacterium]